jgi:putative transposase
MAGRLHRKHHVQLTLESARRETGQGGWRRNAGRKKKPGAVSHDKRADVSPQVPQHVTLRILAGVPNLAHERCMKIIRAVIADSHKPSFRICEFNVLSNHLHLIVEAANKRSLARGVQGFEVRLVKRLNPILGRTGKLFAHRYHARALPTPREVRNALCYVLQNRKHHAAEKRFNKYWVDPFSSAAWFTGWAEPISPYAWMVKDLVEQPPPTKPPNTWLLSTGWRRHGPLRFDERPA